MTVIIILIVMTKFLYEFLWDNWVLVEEFFNGKR